MSETHADERTYTLDEARRELAQQECDMTGHDWQVMETLGGEPVAILCERCGESRGVRPKA